MLINSEEKFMQAIRAINASDKPLVCDTETNGLEWAGINRICGVGVRVLYSTEPGYYFPFRHGEGYNLPIKRLEELNRTVLRHDRMQIGFNYKFDIHMLLREAGYITPLKIRDSQLSAHLLNENDWLKMEALAEKYIDPDAGKAEDALLDLLQERFDGSRKTCKKHLWRLPAEEVAEYGVQDLVTTEELYDLHRGPLKTWGLEDIYHEVCDYSLLVCKMEEHGVLIDKDLTHQYVAEAIGKVDPCKEKAAASAGYPINLNSSKQCQAWLGVHSSAKDVLEILIERGDERAKILQEYRGWAKVNSTYYNKFLALCGDGDVIHPNLNLTGTVIRLACSNPNLQAIPRYTKVYKVKDVMIARDGFEILEADFSQAEVRVMGHYTKDPMLLEIINKGLNMHDKVAEEQDLPRHVAKTLNFSAQYGIGAPTFSKTYGYTLKEARVYLNKYHAMFPGMRRLLNATAHKAEQKGYIRLYTGRVQHFDNHRSPSHKASSRLVQGAVAEMTRIAGQRIDREIPEINQLLQVHDSLLMEVPIGMDCDNDIRRIMCDQPWCTVETKIDIKRGPSWGAAKDVA